MKTRVPLELGVPDAMSILGSGPMRLGALYKAMEEGWGDPFLL